MVQQVLFPQLVEAVRPFFIQIGLPAAPPHIPMALISLSTWLTIQLLSSIISPRLFPKLFATMNQRTKTSWDIHVVSFFHAITVTPAAAYVWWKIRQQGGLQAKIHPLAIDRVYGYDYEAGQVYAIALGYFIWDVAISVLFEGPAFIAHGLVSFSAFVFVYSPVFMYDGLGFLMWEASTPFLNIHWFLDKTGMTGTWLQLINAAFLLGSYVSVRLIFGVNNSISWFRLANFPPTPHVPPIPTHVRLFYSVGNVTLNTLNFVWFRAMIRAVQKRFQTTPVPKEKLDPLKVARGEQSVDKFEISGNNDDSFEEEAGVRRRAVATKRD